MYTYDEIIANGYFVFNDKLSTNIITSFIAVRKTKYGETFNRNNLKLRELKEVMKFENPYYKLATGKTMLDLIPYIKPELVVLFQVIQKSMEETYTNDFEEDSYDEKPYVKKI